MDFFSLWIPPLESMVKFSIQRVVLRFLQYFTCKCMESWQRASGSDGGRFEDWRPAFERPGDGTPAFVRTGDWTPAWGRTEDSWMPAFGLRASFLSASGLWTRFLTTKNKDVSDELLRKNRTVHSVRNTIMWLSWCVSICRFRDYKKSTRNIKKIWKQWYVLRI